MKSSLLRVAGDLVRPLGLSLTRLQEPARGDGYEGVRPAASYAPWTVSSDFLSTYEQIKGHTLVDIYRCWELWTLVGQLDKLAAGALLEVGVWRGGTGSLMARQLSLCGSNDEVFLCDTFQGVVKAGLEDPNYVGGEHADTSQQVAEDLVKSLHLSNVRILNGIFPDQTAHLVEPGTRFRLCHIDVDVYQSAKEVMAWIWDRMVPGGIVVYDDFGFETCKGITQFVNEQVADRDRLVLHNLNGHALVIKMPG